MKCCSKLLLRARAALLLVAFALPLSSCYVLEHTVGNGPTGSESVSQRQFYLFFGGIRLGEQVDSERVAGKSLSYRVRSEWSFTDMLINLFTAPLTITSRTVTVEK